MHRILLPVFAGVALVLGSCAHAPKTYETADVARVSNLWREPAAAERLTPVSAQKPDRQSRKERKRERRRAAQRRRRDMTLRDGSSDPPESHRRMRRSLEPWESEARPDPEAPSRMGSDSQPPGRQAPPELQPSPSRTASRGSSEPVELAEAAMARPEPPQPRGSSWTSSPSQSPRTSGAAGSTDSTESGSAATKSGAAEDEGEAYDHLPFGRPVSGKPGYVTLPGESRNLPEIDVRGIAPGTPVEIPDPNVPGATIQFRVP